MMPQCVHHYVCHVTHRFWYLSTVVLAVMYTGIKLENQHIQKKTFLTKEL